MVARAVKQIEFRTPFFLAENPIKNFPCKIDRKIPQKCLIGISQKFTINFGMLGCVESKFTIYSATVRHVAIFMHHRCINRYILNFI